MPRSPLFALLALAAAAGTVSAQRPGGPGRPQIAPNPQSLPVSPVPEYVRTTAPTDLVVISFEDFADLVEKAKRWERNA